MKIACYHNGAQHQKEAMESFVNGLKLHGIDANSLAAQFYEPTDLAVVWGHRAVHIVNGQRSVGKHYLVMERGYIGDRFQWTSLGFDGLNGRAAFPKIDDGLKRWNANFAQYLKPWRTVEGNLAVIMGQVPGDCSLELMAVDFPLWVMTIAKSLRRDVYAPVFRPHPQRDTMKVAGVPVIAGTLEAALEHAALVVTWNSNSGVDAILAGVPVYAADPGSMVYDISSCNFVPVRPDRSSWCQKMSYTQWSWKEIDTGEAWEAVRTVVDETTI